MYKAISGIHKLVAEVRTTEALQPYVTKSPKNPGNSWHIEVRILLPGMSISST